MAPRTIHLADKKEMLIRLLQISDIESMVQDLYPHFLQYAGRNMYARGIALFVGLGIVMFNKKYSNNKLGVADMAATILSAVVADRTNVQEVLEEYRSLTTPSKKK